MTVNDIATLACQDSNDTGADMLAFAKAQLRRKYEILYNDKNWREAMAEPAFEFDLLPPTGGSPNSQTFALPLPADKVIWVKGSADAGLSFPYNLRPRDRSWIEKNDGAAFLTTTTPQVPRWWYLGKPRGFPTLSPGLITLQPTVSSANPFILVIEGQDNSGLDQTESFSLSGVTPAVTANSYKEVTNISKPFGTVPVSVTPTVGTQVVMQPGTASLRYTVLCVWPPYSGPFRLRVGAKLKIDPILSDTSVPRISGLFDALYYFTRSAIKGRQNQGDSEASDAQMAETMKEQAWNTELAQQGSFNQIQPKVYDDPGDTWDWGGRDYY